MVITNHTTPLGERLSNKRAAKRTGSLALYLLLVFGLSWPFLIASALWAKNLYWGYLLNSTGMVLVTVATLLADTILFRDGFATIGWSWGKKQHYLGVLALVCLLWLPPTIMNLVMGNVKLPLSIHREQGLWIVVLLFVTLLPGFGEELGWRGYLLPQLARQMNGRKAVLVHAIIWWVWHWPALIGAIVQMLKVGNRPVDLPQSLPAAIALVLMIGALPTILHGVVFAWVWWKTQSLAVATVYHTLYDGVRDSLAIMIGGNMIGANAFAGLWPTLVICLLGLLLLWKGDWQMFGRQQGEVSSQN